MHHSVGHLPRSPPFATQRSRTAVRARTRAVLAPADPKSPQPSRPSPAPARGLSAALLSVFRGSQRSAEPGNAALSSLEEATARRAEEADAIEQREKAAKQGEPLPDIRPFLRPVGVLDMRFVRLTSSLSAWTYYLDKVDATRLARMHGLRLVSTSKVCDRRLREPRASPADAVQWGDAMAADGALVAAAQQDIAAGAERGAWSPAMQALARVGPMAPTSSSSTTTTTSTASLPSVDLTVAVAGEPPVPAEAIPAGAALAVAPPPPPPPSAVDRVTASLSAAASAASAAAHGIYTAAVPYAGPLANNITTFTASVTSALPVQSVAAQLQSAAAAGHSGAVTTVATVSAALESSLGRPRLPKECQSPTEWFIADDPASHTRYFVIQGSDNMDHWRVNLTFDPVPFEDAALGVRVHRGVYEAAAALYTRFLPLVQDHLASHPFAQVCFTGHSLGGSLGTLLMLMYVRRGVLHPSALRPVVTFGAPAVFCEGGAGACACDPPGAQPAAAPSPGSVACSTGSSRKPGGLLAALGLPERAVRNVLMTKDIVPRAFACDYSLVADLLKRVSDSFRDHRCLNSSRTLMFDFIGQVWVLQPDEEATYVAGEGYHPLLPPGPGLYLVREPTPLTTAAAILKRDAGFVRQTMQQAVSSLGGGRRPPGASAADSTREAGTQPAARGVGSSRDAVWELMNCPHPLDILADKNAYGDRGSISRYHNPDNYTRALRSVQNARPNLRRLLSRAAASLGRTYIVPTVEPAQQWAAAAAAPLPADAPPAPEPRRPLHGGKQLLRMTRRSSSGDLGSGSPQPT